MSQDFGIQELTYPPCCSSDSVYVIYSKSMTSPRKRSKHPYLSDRLEGQIGQSNRQQVSKPIQLRECNNCCFDPHPALSQLHRLRSMSLWWHCWSSISQNFGSKTWLKCYSPKFKKRICSLDLLLFPVEIQTGDASIDVISGVGRR